MLGVMNTKKIRLARFFRLAPGAALLICLASAKPSFASKHNACVEGHSVKNLQNGQVEFTPTDDDTYVSGHRCRSVVRDSAKNEIFAETDAAFSLVLADADVNGDGAPDLVLESFSGGAHCCWTYYIISLGAKAGLLAKLENERGAAFVRNANGRIDIETQDGAFDYFDGACHACTAFPLVYLRLEGAKFVDAGSEHLAAYDEIIANSQKALSDEQRQELRSLKSKPTEDEGLDDRSVRNALDIVLAYLYSGREQQARQALRELWPASDQQRIWNLILEKRRAGMLSYTQNDAAQSRP